ncbi:MAG: CHAT domain-containing protein [Acidipila sp.]|nr:CHAT domain-containing protein [Acidipila sp.]
MPTAPTKPDSEVAAPAGARLNLLEKISNLTSDAARQAFLARHRRLATPKFARRLVDAVLAQGRVDTQRALRLAQAAVFLSKHLRDDEALGLSLRAHGNALNLAGENQQALELYQQALELFASLENKEQTARTLTNSIQALILIGEYDRAFAAAERARAIFNTLGDVRRIARLDNNVGNIYHRQDRFEEAFANYERAYQQFLPLGDSEELVAALSNMAMCLITLNDFPRAQAFYEQTRAFCDEHKLPLLRAQADYNIAYLYYLRGEYSRAIEMLHAARRRCAETGDHYHFALCHLDLSEIYLELNLSKEARETAHEGSLLFQKLGMGYEGAKCMAYEAMAFSQTGKGLRSLELFTQARAQFVREKNLVWPWLIDLYHALVLFNEGRLFEARRLCARAAAFFDTSFLPGKAVLCHLLLARLALRTGDLDLAEKECARALEAVPATHSLVLTYQAQFLRGEIQSACGDLSAAYRSYQEAREALEALRSSLRGEELKIAFMKNRLEVYENLVSICMGGGDQKYSLEESFRYIELAKSRSLAELLMREGHAIPATDAGQSGLVRRIREMREELNWYYRRIELEQLRATSPSPERIGKLQEQALQHENELLRALRELPAPELEASGTPVPNVASLASVRECLPADAALIEYFSVHDQFIAAVVTRDGIEIVPLTPVSRVANLLRLLNFQMSKFRLGAEYLRAFEKNLLAAARSHLFELYQELLAPLRERLHAKHLIIVPHGVLHYLPFHALFDGERYIIDSFTISYAPSAGIYAFCHRKSTEAFSSSLVLGVPDSRAPFIEDEVKSVAGILSGAELVLGAEESETALREKGLRSRVIHIATHGNFRQDNPLFSGIRLGSSYLNLYDLYQLKLGAELVTLSGCATGMNVVAAGDELLGLIRGLLHAGAQTLLLTLWDVHDRSTAEFMASFYRRAQAGGGRPLALQGAMQELRERYPHPYFWAPFLLIGKAFPA